MGALVRVVVSVAAFSILIFVTPGSAVAQTWGLNRRFVATSASGACGVNKQLVVSMPFNLRTV